MKILFRKCPKSVSTSFFSISKSFSYFHQRKIIRNINISVQNWQRGESFLTHCWFKPGFDSPLYWKRAFGCDWCCITCQYDSYDSPNSFIIGGFFHPCLETSCKSRKNWMVQIVWRLLVLDEANFLIDYDQSFQENWFLQLSISLMNQVCSWLSKAILQRFWISLTQPLQIDHGWYWWLCQEFENTLIWNSLGLFLGDKHCSQNLRSQWRIAK